MYCLEMTGALGVEGDSNTVAMPPVAWVYVGGGCLFSSAGPGRQDQRWQFISTKTPLLVAVIKRQFEAASPLPLWGGSSLVGIADVAMVGLLA